MEQTKEQLLDQLIETAKTLTTDKLMETLDFVGYLRYRSSGAPHSERGSAQRLLRHIGTFYFASGELNQLLTDIAQMRARDLESYA